MKRRTLLLLWGCLALVAHFGPGWIPEAVLEADVPEQSKRTLKYEIDVVLDPKAHVFEATGTLTWRNDSPVPVKDMWLHLYLNAFKDKYTQFMMESGASHRGHRFKEDAPGYIELESFKRDGGPELIDKAEFAHPDGDNEQDTTVIRVPLGDSPADWIAPNGGEIKLRLKWKSKLPRVFARTGYGGDFHMVAQWFPKPGVFEMHEHDGEEVWHWNCHQFHGSSEFYADYGEYRVFITVPEAYKGKVGASGERVSERENEDGTITYEHWVNDVHDFSWVCGKDFVLHTKVFEGGSGRSEDEHAKVAEILGRPKASLALPTVTVNYLLQPEHEDQLQRHIDAVENALTYMGFWFGPYPYKTLTVVDPDHRGRDAGGMEYPTLITGGTRIVRPARQMSPEGVLVHEFAHQHFYGLVGTNEFESAWMDEGMTTYATAKTLMRAYPDQPSVTWYGSLPLYSEPPFRFAGMAADSRAAMPALAHVFDEYLKVPWGRSGLGRSISRGIGVNHPPETISLWAGFDQVGPLAFLRDAPLLSHVKPLPAPVKQRYRSWVASQPMVDPIAGRKAWEYMNRRSYGVNSYGRPSSSLHTLQGLVSEPTMIRIMRTYAETYRFKHPKPEDFFDLATEVAARDNHEDIGWLFDELFRQPNAFDFGIQDITIQDARPPTPEQDGKWFASMVTVRRFAGVRFPMDVNVAFDDGTIRNFRWERDDIVRATDGKGDPEVLTPARGEQSEWVKLYFEGASKVAIAEVDPQRRYWLDRDRSNDGKRTEANHVASWRVALRALGLAQLNTSFYGGL